MSAAPPFAIFKGWGFSTVKLRSFALSLCWKADVRDGVPRRASYYPPFENRKGWGSHVLGEPLDGVRRKEPILEKV